MLRPLASQEDIPADLAALVRIGRVQSIDLAAGTVRLVFGDPDDDDGEAETGDLPWLAPRAGATRIWLPPAIGEQVVFLCPDGDLAAAVAIGSLWRDQFTPPDDADRIVVDFADSGRLIYDHQAHHTELVLPTGGTLRLVAPGGVTIEGNVSIEGDVAVSGTLTAQADVLGGGKSLKGHRHTGVQGGSAQSGPPA